MTFRIMQRLALALTLVPMFAHAQGAQIPFPADDWYLPNPKNRVCTPVAPVNQVSVSDGSVVTPADLAAFDARWMKPEDCQYWLNSAEVDHKARHHGWAYPDRMLAMVHMFELTHDEWYLKHLRQFIELALYYRDDHYPGNPDPACQRCEPTPIDDCPAKIP